MKTYLAAVLLSAVCVMAQAAPNAELVQLKKEEKELRDEIRTLITAQKDIKEKAAIEKKKASIEKLRFKLNALKGVS